MTEDPSSDPTWVRMTTPKTTKGFVVAVAGLARALDVMIAHAAQSSPENLQNLNDAIINEIKNSYPEGVLSVEDEADGFGMAIDIVSHYFNAALNELRRKEE